MLKTILIAIALLVTAVADTPVFAGTVDERNFGFNLPWWDCLLGTYRPQPSAGHNGMTLGVKEFRDPAGLRLDRMLLQPLRRGDLELANSLDKRAEA